MTSTEPMRGLSVRYPWSFCIAKGFKPVENRSKRFPPALVGVPVALQSSLKADAVPWLPTREASRALALAEGDPALSLGAVIAVVRFSASHPWPGGKTGCGDVSWPACTVWSEIGDGVHHWPAEVIAALTDPVPCKGALGLWRLPDDVEKLVRAQLA